MKEFFESTNLVETGTKESAFYRAYIRANNDPDKLGRVRVEYRFFHGQDSALPSEWVRLALPYASKEHGMWFLPEVGDEVLIYVDRGDFDHPILIGTLYNGVNTPPSTGRQGDKNSNNQNNLRFIKTRSGHTLCFDDSDSQNQIVLKDKDNRRFEINSSEQKVVISDSKSNEVALDGSTVTIRNSGGSEVSVKESEISLKSAGGATVTVKANEVVIESASSIKLGSGASSSLVLGEQFLALFNAHTHSITPAGTTPPSSPLPPSVLSKTTKTS